jgi:prepilin-type N-terminal cleavage/methylation domain-containing protein
MKNQKGITLIEAMIVIAILAIVSAIAVSNWSRYEENQRLRNAAREITSTLAEAGAKARSKTIRYYVEFNIAENKYSIQQKGEDPVVRKLSDSTIKITAADFRGELYAEYLPRGIVQEPGYVTLENRRGSTARIDVALFGKTYVTYQTK